MLKTRNWLLLFVTFIYLNDAAGSVTISGKEKKPALLAQKNGKTRYYIEGNAVSITLKTGQNFKGIISHIVDDSVELKLPAKGKYQKLAIKDFNSIMKLGRKGRVMGLVFSLFYFSFLFAAITTTDQADDVVTGWEVLRVAVAIFFGVLLAGFWLLTFPVQLLNKRRVEKGWTFSQGNK